jgi:hypothetical protein
MAITTYTAGDVLTAASLNNNFASGGLQLIKTEVIGTTVASVAVTGAFSSTYDNYKITVTGGVGSTTGNLQLQLGATTTGYYSGLSGANYGNTANNVGQANVSNWAFVGNFNTNTLQMSCELYGPNLTKQTLLSGSYLGVGTATSANFSGGMLNNSTAYTGFTIIASTGTLTGGTIRVYGIANS